ncbi:MAG: MMPL family transporter [Thermodesulfobacteriota bacterium]
MVRYIEWLLRHRFAVLFILALITAFFGWHFSQARVSSSIEEIFFANNPRYDRYEERNREFASDNLLIVGITSGDLCSPDAVKRLRRACDEISALDCVGRVQSFADAQYIRSEEDVLTISDYGDLFAQSPERRGELLNYLNRDELTSGIFITENGQHAVVIAEMASNGNEWETGPGAMDRIKAILEDHGFPSDTLQVGGISAVLSECLRQARVSFREILPITCLILFVTVYLMFRRVWPVLLTMVITGMSVAWTMGLAIILYGHLNIFTTSIPGIVLIICFSDVIHLCSAYLLDITAGTTKDQALRNMGREVGAACLYTSVTTFFGFVSLALVPTPVFRQTGVLLGFGVSAALFITITIMPVLLSFMRAPRPLMRGATGALQGVFTRIISGINRVSERHHRVVNAIFFLLFAVCLVGASRIHFETQFSERFSPRNQIQKGLSFFNKHFPGTDTLDIYLASGKGTDLLDPETFLQTAQLEKRIQAMPNVVQAVSVLDLVRKLYREISPEQAEQNPLPQTREALVQLLFLFDMSGGRDLDRLLSEDRKTMRLSVRLKDAGVIEASNTGNEIARIAQGIYKGKVTAEPLGLKYLIGEWLDDILAGQARGLAFSLITVAICMMAALRSVRIGLISMLPNVLPLLSLLAWAGFFWDKTDTDTMAVLMIAIGIGVDDTIHFLTRLRVEKEKTGELGAALGSSMHYAGRAMIMTTVILAAGFAPFAISDYFSVHILGTLLPACLVVALLADLFWVPSMARAGWIRFPAGARPEPKAK